MPTPVPSPPLTRPIAGAPARQRTGRRDAGAAERPGRGGRWALLPPHHGPRWVELRRHTEQRGVVLGLQRQGSGRRRIDYASAPAFTGLGWAAAEAGRGRPPQLRCYHWESGLLLGRQLYRRARRWHGNRPPGANRGRGRLVVQRREPGSYHSSPIIAGARSTDGATTRTARWATAAGARMTAPAFRALSSHKR